MAKIHPDTTSIKSRSPGAYRERDVIKVLEQGFDNSYDIFHNLDWSAMKAGRQTFGELDVAIVSPQGHVVLLEIKAGKLEIVDGSLQKGYKQFGVWSNKSVATQTKRQFESMKSMLLDRGLEKVRIVQFLVLPDYEVLDASISYPRERIIDSKQFPALISHITEGLRFYESALDKRVDLMAFLQNQFDVKHDFQNHIKQLQNVQFELASGLANWVPKITHQSGIYVVNATAGSGKTQLAKELLKKQTHHKKAYICFNRPLADHMQKIVGINSSVQTFHEYCLEFVKSQQPQFDQNKKDLFNFVEQYYLEYGNDQLANLDLLVIDESQDFKASWLEQLVARLKPGGRLYVLGDIEQNIYSKETFELNDAVLIESNDNYRSPHKLVEFINALHLTKNPIQARSLYQGFEPAIYKYKAEVQTGLQVVNQAVKAFLDDGFLPSQIAVISLKSKDKSKLLTLDEIAGVQTKRPLYTYDDAGNALWTTGEIILDTVYRFKGQSIPALVFCEIDYEENDDKTLKKLLVGFTRAQVKLSLVISEKSLLLLANQADSKLE